MTLVTNFLKVKEFNEVFGHPAPKLLKKLYLKVKVTSMKNSDNVIKLTGLNNLEEIMKNTTDKLNADNEKNMKIMEDRNANMEEERNMERDYVEEMKLSEEPQVMNKDINRFPVDAMVYLVDDPIPNRLWKIDKELYQTYYGYYMYIITTQLNPFQTEQKTVSGEQLKLVDDINKPPTPDYDPNSPKFRPSSPSPPGFEPTTPSPPVMGEAPQSPRMIYSRDADDQLEEDDYDTEDEYGFYDPGPANLEEIIREYEDSRKKMREQQEQSKSKDESNPFDVGDLPADINVNNEEKKDEPERTVVEKDFQEGLDLLASKEDEQEQGSGDEDDNENDRKNVTA